MSDQRTYEFRRDERLAGGCSGSTSDFFGHSVSVSTGQYDPARFGGADRPFGEATVDGVEYWLVPKDCLIGEPIPDPMEGYHGGR